MLKTMTELVKERGSSETILEIGPGRGVLTEELVKLSNRVIAVEIDRRFAPTLEQLRRRHANLEIIFDDILRVNRTALGLRTHHYSVAANLPYEITGQFLQQLLTEPPYPKHLALLLQKEVAQRITAKPGQMSILGLSIQAFCQPRLVCYVPPSAFQPPPKVTSAIVSLEEVRSPALKFFRDATQEENFFRIIKAGFAQRRKFLFNNLLKNERFSSKIQEKTLNKAWLEINLSPKIRAQELSLDQWRQLVDKLEKFIV